MTVDAVVLGAALLTGVVGGAHCAAMCGGIATGFTAALPRPDLRHAIQPNVGRVLGYVAAGALVGVLGHGVVDIARSPTLMTWLRVATGATLVLIAARVLGWGAERIEFGQGALWRMLRPLQARLLPANSTSRRLLLGVLWGWMPCGLSTTVLLTAWLQADALASALVMLAFGLGTLPLMVSLTWTGARLGRRLHQGEPRTALGGIVLVAGVLTAASPWLMHVAPLQPVLAALGCLPRTA